MNKLLLLLFIIQVSYSLAQPPQKNLPPEYLQFDYQASQRPDRILLSWTEDPSTTITITWRSSTTAGKAYAQIAEATASPAFEDYDHKEDAHTTRMEALFDTAAYHQVTFRGLKPNTSYAYRVHCGNYRSEWVQIKTAPESFEPFRFIYMGDAQNDLYEHWSRTIRAAYSYAPDARFVLHAGDLVNHSQNNYEWGEWFEAMGFISKMIPTLATPGNHEYIKDGTGKKVAVSPFWEAQFSFPTNGSENGDDMIYYLDYPGMRLISLNSNEYTGDQVAWLEHVLSSNEQPWCVVFFHHPVFSAARGRENAELEKNWRPLLEKYNVDLVLQGHDHAYARGNPDPGNTPVYVVSVSGTKMYEITEQPWIERAAENTQLFQMIEVLEDRMIFKAVTVDGDIYDAFEIHRKPGQVNRVVPHPHDPIKTRTFQNTLNEKD